MKPEHRKDGWWITGVPEYWVDGKVCTEYGPYDTKKDAEDARRGAMRSLDILERQAWSEVYAQ